MRYDVYISEYSEPDYVLGSFDTISEAKKYMKKYLKETNYWVYSLWIEKIRKPLYVTYFESEEHKILWESYPDAPKWWLKALNKAVDKTFGTFSKPYKWITKQSK